MDFDSAFELTMSWEGGGVLHMVAGDPGGLTVWGVSQRAYPDLDLSRLTKDDAKEIVKRDYWDVVAAHALPWTVRWDVFDFAFNAGPYRAVKALQKTINAYRRARNNPLTVAEDGVMGPETVNGAQETQLIAHDILVLRRIYRAYRVRHYLDLAHNGMWKFLGGWLRRVEGEWNV